MQRHTLLMCFCLSFTLIISPCALRAEEPTPQDASSNILAEFPIYNDGDYLLLPISVYGGTYQFIFDTGCPITVFDTHLTPNITDSEESEKDLRPLQTISGEILEDVEHVTISQFAVGDLPPFRNRTVASMDLSQFRDVTGHEVRGLLGMDLFQEMVVRIDADNGRLQLLKARPKSAVHPIPVHWPRTHSPHIRLSLRHMRLDSALIDTGFSGVNTVFYLDANLYERFEREGSMQTHGRSLVMTLAGSSESKAGVLETLAVQDGPTLHKVPTGEERGGRNILGLGFLLQFNAILDVPGSALLLEPRETTTESGPIPRKRSGLHLLRRGPRTFVHSIDENSRAEEAGIEPDDTIESVAGKPASEFRLHKLRELIDTVGPDLEMELRLQRGPIGATRRVMLSRTDSE